MQKFPFTSSTTFGEIVNDVDIGTQQYFYGNPQGTLAALSSGITCSDISDTTGKTFYYAQKANGSVSGTTWVKINIGSSGFTRTSGALANAPTSSSGTALVYQCSDYPMFAFDNGSSMEYWSNTGFKFTPVNYASFTNYWNTTGITFDTTKVGGLYITNANSGNSTTCPSLTAKSITEAGNTYTLTMACIPHIQSTTVSLVGMCLYDTVGGAAIRFDIYCSAGSPAPTAKFSVTKVNAAKTINSDYSSTVVYSSWNSPRAGILWLQIKANGTTRSFRYSTDGFNWTEITNTTVTDFITPNAWGFYTGEEGSTSSGSNLRSMQILHAFEGNPPLDPFS